MYRVPLELPQTVDARSEEGNATMVKELALQIVLAVTTGKVVPPPSPPSPNTVLHVHPNLPFAKIQVPLNLMMN